jgi:hypothetical protein
MIEDEYSNEFGIKPLRVSKPAENKKDSKNFFKVASA